MAPRCLFAMIAEWHTIADYRAQVQAFVSNGGELEEREKPHREEEEEAYYVHPDAF